MSLSRDSDVSEARLKRSSPEIAVRELAKTVGFVVLLVILIRSVLVQAYHIPSGSMEDTLREGDYVIGDKLTYGTQIPDRLPLFKTKLPSFRMPGLTAPQPGDLVIFEFPGLEKVSIFHWFLKGPERSAPSATFDDTKTIFAEKFVQFL